MTDLRPFTPAEMPAAHTALELAFGNDPHPEDQEVELTLIDPALTLGAWDGDTVVATAGWFDLEMTSPGGVVPVAGVTWVSVAPTHRRQGLLTQMMKRQLDDVRAAGRSVAVLWASEGAIYQRFGYGPASWHQSFDVRRGAAFTRDVDVTGLRVVTPTAEALSGVYDAVLATRPGWYRRDAGWWRYRLYDPSHRRGGATQLRAVVDGSDGYALYRTDASWGPTGPEGTVKVGEVVARTPESEARLWRFLLDQDLMVKVTAWAQPMDSPLLQLLAEPRRATATVSDALYVRVVDVGAALAQRALTEDLVVEVTDALLPDNAGRWLLTGERTDRSPDLRLDVRELGATWLGGTRLRDRATAGHVEELTPGAVDRATAALSWTGRAPHCPMVF